MGTKKPSTLVRPAKKEPSVLFGTPVSTLMVWVGLFTVSWDRLAQVTIGSFNVKVPVVAFALAFLLTLFDMHSRRVGASEGMRPVVVSAWLVGTLFFVAGLFAVNVELALVQFVAVVIGAFLPFAAVYLNVKTFGGLDAALTALIRGGVVAASFGLYQLVAFYTGLPQFIQYFAKAGGLGRISSFSYEAGYFAYFMILVIAALFARAHVRGEPVSRRLLVFLTAVLLLANSRATLFALPLLLVLIFARQPSKSVRLKLVPVVVFMMTMLGLAWAAVPDFFNALAAHAVTVFDPNEKTSNAPRLNGFDVALSIIHQNPIMGIGGGNLRDTAAFGSGVVNPGLSANEVIANNIWLQALLDGGFVLLVAEVILIVAAARCMYRRRTPAARFLMAGWLSVLLVSSMITSYYFDVKLWAVLALACATALVEPAAEPPITPTTADRKSGSSRIRSTSGSLLRRQ